MISAPLLGELPWLPDDGGTAAGFIDLAPLLK
jgi:hypothetical protein